MPETKRKFDWQRIWFRVRRHSNDVDESASTESTTFAQIQNEHCVVLLGEHGMGKSTEVEKHSSSEHTLTIDLASMQEGALSRRFQKKVPKNWKDGTSNLFLFLENFERLNARNDAFAVEVQELLDELPRERVFLRIVSRTSEWSSTVENALREQFADKCAIYELAPLTERDIQIAATAELTDPAKFISAIYEKNILPLAIRPVTLNLLFDLFEKSGDLPESASELYEHGCYLLCGEINSDIAVRGRGEGKFSKKERLAAASLAAALLVFCNKNSIWRGINSSVMADDALSFDDLVGRSVRYRGLTVQITKGLLDETFEFGLFTSFADNTVVCFAHQSYAEFLGAMFCAEQGFTSTQVGSLLFYKGDDMIVPQLMGVAAWLVTVIPNSLGMLVARSPDAMIMCDLDKLGDSEKELIVEHFLECADNIKRRLWQLEDRYPKLRHIRLCNQLKFVIADKNRNPTSRAEAIRIAHVCRLTDVVDDVLLVALDEKDDSHLRALAMLLIFETNDGTLKSRLFSLAKDSSSSKWLRRMGFLAAYPDLVSCAELLDEISAADEDCWFLGTPWSNLFGRMLERMPEADIPLVLSWVKDHDDKKITYIRAGDITDLVVLSAWKRSTIESTQIIRSIAELALNRLLAGRSLVAGFHAIQFGARLRSETDLRRHLISNTIEVAKEYDRTVFDLACAIEDLCIDEDFPWLLNLLGSATGKKRELIAALAQRKFKWKLDHLEIVFADAYHRQPEVKEWFAAFRRPSDSDPDLVKRLKEEFVNCAGGTKSTSPPQSRLVELIAESEAGNGDAWVDILKDLRLHSSESSYDEEFFELDITALSAWSSISEQTRLRLISCARKFLCEDGIKPNGPDTGSIGRSGLKAFMLLHRESPSDFESLMDDRWVPWIPTLIAYHAITLLPRYPILIESALARAPEVVLQALRNQLLDENERDVGLPSLSGFDGFRDNRVNSMLFDLLRKTALSVRSRYALMRYLFRNDDSTELRTWTENQVLQFCTDNEHQAALPYAVELAIAHTIEIWEVLWTLIRNNSAFGQSLFLEWNSMQISNDVLSKLTDEQLSSVYIWSTEQTDANDLMARLEQHCLTILERRGNTSSCATLERLCSQLPQKREIRRHLAGAKERFRKASWIPPRPSDIVQLGVNSEARFVDSEVHLLEVVMESIKRLQSDLTAQSAVLDSFWNVVPARYIDKKRKSTATDRSKKYFPKEEDASSRCIESYLRSDIGGRKIVFNREVRVGYPNQDRTDIYVTGISDRSDVRFGQVTIVIEVKPLWREDLLTAMETQLVARYLPESNTSCGLYLAIHFNCSLWDPDDDQKRVSSRFELADITRRLEEQAKTLSVDGRQVFSFVLDASLPPPRESR